MGICWQNPELPYTTLSALYNTWPVRPYFVGEYILCHTAIFTSLVCLRTRHMHRTALFSSDDMISKFCMCGGALYATEFGFYFLLLRVLSRNISLARLYWYRIVSAHLVPPMLILFRSCYSVSCFVCLKDLSLIAQCEQWCTCVLYFELSCCFSLTISLYLISLRIFMGIRFLRYGIQYWRRV